MSESSPEDMADTKHARSTAIFSSAERIGLATDMNVYIRVACAVAVAVLCELTPANPFAAVARRTSSP